MPRDGQKARNRLQEAALELYSERGFDGTTAAQIAAHAGVTERTFFRHFADKREALFEGETEFAGIVIGAIDAVPIELLPIKALRQAFISIAPFIEEYRPLLQRRHQIIISHPALRERELSKSASLIVEVKSALGRRGVSERKASIAARVGLAVLTEAMSIWMEEPSEELELLLSNGFESLHALVASS